MTIKTIFLFIFLIHSLHAKEVMEDLSPGGVVYLKKGIPTLAAIKEKKILGCLTSFIPLSILCASVVGILSGIFIDKEGMGIDDEHKLDTGIFLAILAAGAVIATSSIPVHYFMQAQVEKEQYFFLNNNVTLGEETKILAKKYADKLKRYFQ